MSICEIEDVILHLLYQSKLNARVPTEPTHNILKIQASCKKDKVHLIWVRRSDQWDPLLSAENGWCWQRKIVRGPSCWAPIWAEQAEARAAPQTKWRLDHSIPEVGIIICHLCFVNDKVDVVVLATKEFCSRTCLWPSWWHFSTRNCLADTSNFQRWMNTTLRASRR